MKKTYTKPLSTGIGLCAESVIAASHGIGGDVGGPVGAPPCRFDNSAPDEESLSDDNYWE